VAVVSSPDSTPSRSAASLARGVAATGWYIATSMAFFLVGTLFVWGVVVLFARGGWRAPVTLIGFPLLSAVIVAATVVLLVRYRRDGDLDDADRPSWRRRFLSVPVIAGVVSSMILGAVAESALLGASLVGATLCVVRWGPGIR
jgi:two-component system sensor histidine kinase DesK